MNFYHAQPRDIENTPIQGSISNIPDVQTFTATSGEWIPIYMNYYESKKIILQPRDEIDWYFATTSGGDYFTFRRGAAIQSPVVTTSGTLICWARPSDSTTFELMIGH